MDQVFKERTWIKLLNPSENVFVKIIREFFANALVEEERIKLLGEAKRIFCHKGNYPRGIGSSSTISTNFYPI